MTFCGGSSGRGCCLLCTIPPSLHSMEARHGGLGPGEEVWVGLGSTPLGRYLFFPSFADPLLVLFLFLCRGCVYTLLSWAGAPAAASAAVAVFFAGGDCTAADADAGAAASGSVKFGASAG